MACIAFFVFPASVLPVIRLSRKIKKFTRRGQVSTGMLTSLLQESIQGNRIVKAFGMERYEDDRFMTENWQLFKHSLRATRTKVDRRAGDGATGFVRHWRRGLVWRVERYRRRAHARRILCLHGRDVSDVRAV